MCKIFSERSLEVRNVVYCRVRCNEAYGVVLERRNAWPGSANSFVIAYTLTVNNLFFKM